MIRGISASLLAGCVAATLLSAILPEMVDAQDAAKPGAAAAPPATQPVSDKDTRDAAPSEPAAPGAEVSAARQASARRIAEQRYCLNSWLTPADENELAQRITAQNHDADPNNTNTVTARSLTDAEKRNEVVTINKEQLEVADRAAAGAVVSDVLLLPGGSSIDLGLDAPFKIGQLYYAYLVFPDNQAYALENGVVARPANADDPLVKKDGLGRNATIVTVPIPDVGWLAWRRPRLYIFNCYNKDPLSVHRVDMRVSPKIISELGALLGVLLIYVAAALALNAKDAKGWRRILSALDPLQFTIGMDGKASLGKLQVMFFSLIVFALVLLFLLRTGTLTDISATVLSLLGIVGAGSAVAKGADLQRTTISADNKAWLLRKKWIKPGNAFKAGTASWADLFNTEGEFDVYRYQSFIFTLVVGGALLIGGIARLSSFEIPQTLLELLGLSQVVYIGGKLVTPTSIADLNKVLDSLREAEVRFRSAARTANGGVLPAELTTDLEKALKDPYDAYRSMAADALALFIGTTGLPATNANTEPALI